MLKKLVVLLVLFFNSFAFSQNQKCIASKIDFIPLEAQKYVGFDGLGNYYYIKNNFFYKSSKTNTWNYQNINLGEITKIDIINPLKMVLFYENFNTVVFLDDQLNEIQKINFSLSQIPIVASAVGLAGQNQLWIYNNQNQQLGLFDTTSNQYKTLGSPINETLSYYTSNFNYFNWINTKNQWFRSDVYGKTSLINTLASFDFVEISNENEIMSLENGIFYLNKNTIKYKIDIVEKSIKNFFYKDQILSIFTSEGITNYKITIP